MHPLHAPNPTARAQQGNFTLKMKCVVKLMTQIFLTLFIYVAVFPYENGSRSFGLIINWGVMISQAT